MTRKRSTPTRVLNLLSMLSLAALVTVAGCDAVGGGSSNTPEPPAKPEYERAFDEFSDVPNQITAQVEWAAQPIDEAILLADEISALRTKLDIDAETFTAMCSVAFKDGTVEIGGVAMAEDVKAEFEATLKHIKEVGDALATIPDRTKVAGKQIQKMVFSTPKLVLKATKELSGELAVAVGDGGAQIEADIDTVKQLPETVKAEAMAAKDVLAELPEKAKTASQNLMAAMAGKPYTPLETTSDEPAEGGGGEAAGGAGEDASAGGVVASGGGGGGVDVGVGGGGGAIALPSNRSKPSEPVINARVLTLQSRAEQMGSYGDWLSASNALHEAALLDSDNAKVLFQAGTAAYKAKDCDRALTHLETFVSIAPSGPFASEIQRAKKSIGEIKTFDCTPRTAEDDAAVAETRRRQALALAKDKDWGGAADKYAQAYQITPQDHDLGFEVGVAAWKAGACSDALTYFMHFATTAPSSKRQKIREADKYIERARQGECKPLPADQANKLARSLYSQGQTLELALDYDAAAGKYERAYALLPSNYVLGFKAGEAYWETGNCRKAEPFYRSFVAEATDPRYAEDLARAKTVVAWIDANGCPAGKASVVSAGGGGGGGTAVADSGGGQGADAGPAPAAASAEAGAAGPADGEAGGDASSPSGGAPNEDPPPSGEGLRTVACSVAANDGGGAGGLLGLGLIALALGSARRRRRRE